MMAFLLTIFFVYLAWSLAAYAIPLAAVVFSKKNPSSPAMLNGEAPFLWVVGSCRNDQNAIAGLIECLKKQDYPKNRYRILILADNCADESASVARSLGVDVYERTNAEKMSKGFALTELFDVRLRHENFDGVVLFDIDARVPSDFLRRVAVHFQNGASVMQGSTLSKNPNDTLLTKVGDAVQAVIRSNQKGRSRFGFLPIMIGSHGMALSRESLVRLDWSFGTGLEADDLEVGLLCLLRGIPVSYHDDLNVTNDLPAEASAVRKQRRRWTRGSLRIARHYAFPLLKASLRGNGLAFEALVNLVLNPSFSNLFLWLSVTAGAVTLLSHFSSRWEPWMAAAWILWFADVFYFLAALALEGVKMDFKTVKGIFIYLGVRSIAAFEGLILVRSREWWTTAHGRDSQH